MPASNFAAPFILVGRRVRARVVGGYMSVRVRLVCGLLLFVSCEEKGGKDVRQLALGYKYETATADDDKVDWNDSTSGVQYKPFRNICREQPRDS